MGAHNMVKFNKNWFKFYRMIGRSASHVPEPTTQKIKATQGQGYMLLGRGLCRGEDWQDPQGIWPKFEGIETVEDCFKECKKDKGCTAFDVSPSDLKSKFRKKLTLRKLM